MARSVLVLMALAAAPAWAVGERISLPKGAAPFTEQLRETLCISMECGAGVDASLTAKVIKGNKAEIKVLGPGGAVKATITAPINEAGRMSTMDLVAATSGIIAGIESSGAPAAPVVEKKSKRALASKAKKKSSLKLAAKGRGGHSRG